MNEINQDLTLYKATYTRPDDFNDEIVYLAALDLEDAFKLMKLFCESPSWEITGIKEFSPAFIIQDSTSIDIHTWSIQFKADLEQLQLDTRAKNCIRSAATVWTKKHDTENKKMVPVEPYIKQDFCFRLEGKLLHFSKWAIAVNKGLIPKYSITSIKNFGDHTYDKLIAAINTYLDNLTLHRS